MSPILSAVKDLTDAITQHRVWTHLGWLDVKQRYRRSIIGPWWISLSMFIFVLMMGIVFSKLFQQNLDQYMPFFAAGYLFWIFISSSISEAVDIFKSNSGFIKQINLPYNLYIFKHLVRHSIILMHNFFVYLIICAFFKINPTWDFFLVFPGFFVLLINVYWISFLIAIVCVRFGDMGPIINSCVQIAFFITPVTWMPKLINPDSYILKLNPFVYLLDIVRSPLLGHSPAANSWLLSLGLALIGCLCSLSVFLKVRPRIALWVD